MTRAEPDSAIRLLAPVERIDDRRIVRLPSDASARLPSRGQVAVDATIGDVTVRTVVEPDGRRGHWLDADLLGAHGEVVAASLVPRPSSEWPEPDVPGDLGAALGDAVEASGTWAAITSMARWEWVRWVRATRSPDTRARRVAVSIDKLATGARRPCCFDLSSCTDPELARSGRLVDAGRP